MPDKIIPLQQASANLQQWFNGEDGQLMLQQQKQQIMASTSSAKGLVAIQCGLTDHYLLDVVKRMRHYVRIVPEQNQFQYNQNDNAETLISTLENLPFAENSVDLILIHHCLEYLYQPHLLLREAALLLKPQADLIILLFNQASLLGFHQMLAKRSIGSRQRRISLQRHQHISLKRVENWLEIIDCYPLNIDKGFYLGSSKNKKNSAQRERLNLWLSRKRLWGNGFYLIHARKYVSGYTGTLKANRQRSLNNIIALGAKPTTRNAAKTTQQSTALNASPDAD